jgi:hypothetical protein
MEFASLMHLLSKQNDNKKLYFDIRAKCRVGGNRINVEIISKIK